jgi:hypothetical protein
MKLQLSWISGLLILNKVATTEDFLAVQKEEKNKMSIPINISTPQNIYLNQIKITLNRLAACEIFLNDYANSKKLPVLESAILQMRKAMECFAFATVAPNKDAYVNYRKESKNPDYTKDFNARAICRYLQKINPDFYPKPAQEPIKTGPGQWHIARPSTHPLPQKEFESFYDRLGKFLHSDNPWGSDKGITNLLKDLPKIIDNLRTLLTWHFTTIKTPQFSEVWVVKAFSDGSAPMIITGQSTGDFTGT